MAVLDGVLAAAGNMAHRVLGGGFADFTPMPRTLVDQGRARFVYHYDSADSGDPVLLVPPLAVPDTPFDLRRGCSLVEHLARRRPTYLLDYGPIGFRDRDLGLEHWVDEVLPAAIGTVRERTGRAPHLIGWCFGGILSVLAAARLGIDAIATLTVVASPFDFTKMPLLMPFRPIVAATGGHAFTPVYRAMGTIPAPLVRAAFQVSALDRHLTKPIAVATHLHDRDYLAQIEAVERFTANMVAYPGRTVGQIYHQFYRANALARGAIEVGGTRIDLAAAKQRTLLIAGRADTIAPRRAVGHLVKVLPDAEVEFVTAKGGHLGVLTGRAARHETWPLIDRHLNG
ncbi:alpha/beta hydrolase [Actinokineospora fastidiosa]|uniref:Alpha/beta hydrolase n=1 Tax=Actinokineospora fastidiosa TaxID=1816 RepID=A0A918LF77_9PSEU|nr:alpha/beta hydrolase [Actinokineospora fastidiosa]GGS41650.1 alpha/beta hydrolase [Actinokineospora fastidiosa]